MKHESLDSVLATAAPLTTLSVSERRERLIELLSGKFADQSFPMGSNLEHMERSARYAFSCSGSIMQMAANDPVFATSGLEGDTYGHFKEYFALSEVGTHAVACNCIGGATGKRLADRLQVSGF